MFERIVSLILNKFLSKYIYNLEKENVKIGILESDIKLHNLEIKSDALYNFGIPITIKAGYIGTIVCDLKWSKSESLVILVEDVFIIAEPLTQGPFDLGKEQKFLRALKRKILSEVSARFTPLIDAADNEKEEQMAFETNNYFDRFLIKLLKKIKIDVKNVHIKYEDSISKPGHVITIGLIMDYFSLEESTATWYTDNRVKESKDFTKYKVGKVRSVFLYWNVKKKGQSRGSIFKQIGQVLSWRNWMKEFIGHAMALPTIGAARGHTDSGFKVYDKQNPHNNCDYVLKHFNVRIMLSLSKRDSHPSSAQPGDVLTYVSSAAGDMTGSDKPKIGIDIEFDPLHLTITKQQYASLFDLLSSYSRMLANLPFHIYYPIDGEIKGAAMAWKCFIKIIINKCVKPYQWNTILTYRKNYKKYKNLIFRMYTIGLSTWEISDMEELEDILNLTTIIVAREDAKLEYMKKCPSSEKIKDVKLVNSWWMQYPINFILPPNLVPTISRASNADDYYGQPFDVLKSIRATQQIKDIQGNNIHYSEEGCCSLFGSLNKDDLADIYKFVLGGSSTSRSLRSRSSKRKHLKSSKFHTEAFGEPNAYQNQSSNAPTKAQPIDHQVSLKIPIIEINIFPEYLNREYTISVVKIDMSLKHRWEHQGLDLQMTLKYFKVISSGHENREPSIIVNSVCDSLLDYSELLKLRLETFPVYDKRLQFSLYLGLQKLRIVLNHDILEELINFSKVPGSDVEYLLIQLFQPIVKATRLCYSSLSETFRSRPLFYLKGDITLPEFIINCKTVSSLNSVMSINLDLGIFNVATNLPKISDNLDLTHVRNSIKLYTTKSQVAAPITESLFQELVCCYKNLKISYDIHEGERTQSFDVTPLPLKVMGSFNHVLEHELIKSSLYIDIKIDPYEINVNTTYLDYVTTYMDLKRDLSSLVSTCLVLFEPINLPSQLLFNNRQSPWLLTVERCSCYHKPNPATIFNRSNYDFHNRSRFKKYQNVTTRNVEDMLRYQRLMADEIKDIKYFYAVEVKVTKLTLKIYCTQSQLDFDVNKFNLPSAVPQDTFLLAYFFTLEKSGFLGKISPVAGKLKTFCQFYLGNINLEDHLSMDAASLHRKSCSQVVVDPNVCFQRQGDLYVPLINTPSKYRFLSIFLIYNGPDFRSLNLTLPSYEPSLIHKHSNCRYRIYSWDNTIMLLINPIYIRLDQASITNVHRLIARSNIYKISSTSPNLDRDSILYDAKWERRKSFMQALAVEKLFGASLDIFMQFRLAVHCSSIKIDLLCYGQTKSAEHLTENYCYVFDVQDLTSYAHYISVSTASDNKVLRVNRSGFTRRCKSHIDLSQTFSCTDLANKSHCGNLLNFRFIFAVRSFDLSLKSLWNTKILSPYHYEVAPKVIILSGGFTELPLFEFSYSLVQDPTTYLNDCINTLCIEFGNFQFAISPMVLEPLISFCKTNYLILVVLFVLGVFGNVTKLIYNTMLFECPSHRKLKFTLAKSKVSYSEDISYVYQDDNDGNQPNSGLEIFWDDIDIRDNLVDRQGESTKYQQFIQILSNHERNIKIEALCIAHYAKSEEEVIHKFLVESISMETAFSYFITENSDKNKSKISCTVIGRLPFTSIRINIGKEEFNLVTSVICYISRLINLYDSDRISFQNYYKDIFIDSVKDIVSKKCKLQSPVDCQTFIKLHISIQALQFNILLHKVLLRGNEGIERENVSGKDWFKNEFDAIKMDVCKVIITLDYSQLLLQLPNKFQICPKFQAAFKFYESSIMLKQPPRSILNLHSNLSSVYSIDDEWIILSMTKSIADKSCDARLTILLSYTHYSEWNINVTSHPSICINFTPYSFSICLLYISLLNENILNCHALLNLGNLNEMFKTLRTIINIPQNLTITSDFPAIQTVFDFDNATKNVLLKLNVHCSINYKRVNSEFDASVTYDNVTCLYNNIVHPSNCISYILIHPFTCYLTYAFLTNLYIGHELKSVIKLNIHKICTHISPGVAQIIILFFSEYYSPISCKDYAKFLNALEYHNTLNPISTIPKTTIDIVQQFCGADETGETLISNFYNRVQALISYFAPKPRVLLQIQVRDACIFIEDISSFPLPIICLKLGFKAAAFIKPYELLAYFGVDLEAYMLNTKQASWQTLIECNLYTINDEESRQPWGLTGILSANNNSVEINNETHPSLDLLPLLFDLFDVSAKNLDIHLKSHVNMKSTQVCEIQMHTLNKMVKKHNYVAMLTSKRPLDINITPDTLFIITQFIRDLYTHCSPSFHITLNNRLGVEISQIQPSPILKCRIHKEPPYTTYTLNVSRFYDSFYNHTSESKDSSCSYPLNCSLLSCKIDINSSFPGKISETGFYPGRSLTIKVNHFEDSIVIDLYKINASKSHRIRNGNNIFTIYSYVKITRNEYTITLFSGYRLYNNCGLSFKILILPKRTIAAETGALKFFILLPHKYYDIPLAVLTSSERLYLKPIPTDSNYFYTRIDRLILNQIIPYKYISFKSKNAMSQNIYAKLNCEPISEHNVRRRRTSYTDEIFQMHNVKYFILEPSISLHNHLPCTLSLAIANVNKAEPSHEIICEMNALSSIYHLNPTIDEFYWRFKLKHYLSHNWETSSFITTFKSFNLPSIIEFKSSNLNHSFTTKLRKIQNSVIGFTLHVYAPNYLINQCGSSISFQVTTAQSTLAHHMIFDQFYILPHHKKSDRYILSAYSTGTSQDSTQIAYQSSVPFQLLSQNNKHTVCCNLISYEATFFDENPKNLTFNVIVERSLSYPSFNIIRIYPEYLIKNFTNLTLGFGSLPYDSNLSSQNCSLDLLIPPYSTKPYWPVHRLDNTMLLLSEIDNQKSKLDVKIPIKEPLLTTINFKTTHKHFHFTLEITCLPSNITVNFKKYHISDSPVMAYNFCAEHSIHLKQYGLSTNCNPLVLKPLHVGSYAWEDLTMEKALSWEMYDICCDTEDYKDATVIRTNKEKAFGSCFIFHNEKTTSNSPSHESDGETMIATLSMSSSQPKYSEISRQEFNNNDSSKKISQKTYLSPSIYAKLLYDAQITSSISDDPLKASSENNFSRAVQLTIYWASFLNKNLQRTIVFTKERKLAEYLGMPQSERNVNINSYGISYVHKNNIGISVIGPTFQELIYISLSNAPSEYMLHSMNLRKLSHLEHDSSLEISYKCKNEAHKVKFLVQRLQVDNQILNAVYPCVLYPSPHSRNVICLPNANPMLKVTLKFQLQEGTFHLNLLKNVAVQILPFDVNIDRGFLLSLWSYYSHIKSNHTKLTKANHQLKEFLQGEKIIIENICVSEIQVNICFTIRGGYDIPEDDLSANEFINFCLDFFGSSVADVSNVDLNLVPYEKKDLCQSVWDLLADLVSHYIYRGVWQSYVFVLGLDIIGNPYNFIRDLTVGFKHLITCSKDVNVSIYGKHRMRLHIDSPAPTEPVYSYLSLSFCIKLITFIIKTCGIVLGPFLAISENLSETLSILTFDRLYQRERKCLLYSPTKTLSQQITKTIRCVSLGLVSGLCDFIYLPIIMYNVFTHENYGHYQLREKNESAARGEEELIFEDSLDHWTEESIENPNSTIAPIVMDNEPDYVPYSFNHIEVQMESPRGGKSLNMMLELFKTILVSAMLKPLISVLDGLSCLLDIGRDITGVGEPVMQRVRPPRACNPVIGLPHFTLDQALCNIAYDESCISKGSSNSNNENFDLASDDCTVHHSGSSSDEHNLRNMVDRGPKNDIFSSDLPEHFIFIYAAPACDIIMQDYFDSDKDIPTTSTTIQRYEPHHTLIILTNKSICYLAKSFFWGTWKVMWADKITHIKNLKKDITKMQLSYFYANDDSSQRLLRFTSAHSLHEMHTNISSLLLEQ